MSKGSIQIYTSAAEQAVPLAGVSLTVLDESGGALAHLTSDADGYAEAADLPAPAASYSLNKDNTTVRPYAVYRIEAALDGWQPLVVDGVQVFDGQATAARLTLLPAGALPSTARSSGEVETDVVNIPPHTLFSGESGSGPAPEELLPGSVLNRIVVPKKITVHLGKPSANVSNVTVSFQSYIANVASSEVYPTCAGAPCPTTPGRAYTRIGRIPFCGGSTTSLFTAAQTFARVSGAVSPHNSFCISASASAIGR